MKLRFDKSMSSRIFKEPFRNINDQYLKVDANIKRLENVMRNKQKEINTQYIELISKLDTLSPLKTLTRGYSVTEKDGKMVKSVKELKVGDKVTIKLIDGKIKAQIV